MLWKKKKAASVPSPVAPCEAKSLCLSVTVLEELSQPQPRPPFLSLMNDSRSFMPWVSVDAPQAFLFSQEQILEISTCGTLKDAVLKKSVQSTLRQWMWNIGLPLSDLLSGTVSTFPASFLWQQQTPYPRLWTTGWLFCQRLDCTKGFSSHTPLMRNNMETRPACCRNRPCR